MTEVDLRRAPRVRVVDDIDAGDVRPGDVEIRGSVPEARGYAFACPGCGSRSWLAVGGDLHPCWSLTAGDFARPETASLSPSILHAPQLGGCGWHGHLTAGEFRPC